MTFSLKALVAFTPFIAASAALADTGLPWQFESGSASLTLSTAALQVLDASGVALSVHSTGAATSATYDGVGAISMALSGATTHGDQVDTLTAMGAQIHLDRRVVSRGVTVLSREIILSDFVFSQNFNTLSAKVTGVDLLTNESTDHGFSPVFWALATPPNQGISPVHVPYQFEVTQGSFNQHTEGALTIDPDTTSTFLAILGLPLTGPIANLASQAEWGTISNAAMFSVATPMPEPSSAGLMLLGGLAVLGAARARRQTTA